MTTSVYSIKFKDGKVCTCIATEPATDEENMESILGGFCGKIEAIEPMRRPDLDRQKEARE